MREDTTFVGLDAHKKAINVALRLPDGRFIEWIATNQPNAIRQLARKILRNAVGEVKCCYEAGPCGYALQRLLLIEGVDCIVAAPSLIPIKPGERIKTDRRDARKLAQHLRAGDLTEVRPPSEAEEAVRDLCRCREDAKQDLTRARHRLSKLLLRYGMIYSEGRPWTQKHRAWLRRLCFDHGATNTTFNDYLLSIEQIELRLRDLEDRMAQLALESPIAQPVAWLRCFRGIDTVTAMTIVTELHDFRRFQSPRQLMSYLGLVPSEHSSSDKVRRGAITKTGNAHVRRVLVEAAWHYRYYPRVAKALAQRRKNQPGAVIAIADEAQRRLYKRFCRLQEKGKPRTKVVTAVARELVGFIWAALKHETNTGVTHDAA